MTDHDRDSDLVPEIRYDNWPLADRGEYADWDVKRTSQGQRDGATEEYDAERVDDVEWIGFVGGHESGHPLLYSPVESTLYEGEVDEAGERVLLRDVSRDDVDEDSLGEHLEEIGDEHGWGWLSSFARTHLEDDTDDGPAFEHRTSEFQQRNVGATEAKDLVFFGSHTFADDSGRVHTIERYFDAYRDAASDGTRVEVEEEYLIAEESAEERRGGDADIAAQNERELDAPVDLEESGGESELAAYLEDWHAERAGWHRTT